MLAPVKLRRLIRLARLFRLFLFTKPLSTCLVVDIRLGKYPPHTTHTEENSCFSIYQNSEIL